MKKLSVSIITLLISLFFISHTSAQFNHIPKKPGHYTAEDWRAAIDSTWACASLMTCSYSPMCNKTSRRCTISLAYCGLSWSVY